MGFLLSRKLTEEERMKGQPLYDEVLSYIGLGRYNYFLLAVCGLCLMQVTIEALNMAFTMPFLQCEIEIPTGLEGLVKATGFFGLILSSHLWGFLTDTWGRVKVLRTALAIVFVFSVISSLSVNAGMLAFTRFLVGCG